MRRKINRIMAGVTVVALAAGGTPALSEGGEPDHPVLWSDTTSLPVPSFALPSDNTSLNELTEYLYRTDPTGQVTDNIPSPSIPSEVVNKTDLHFLTYSEGGSARVDTTQSACAYYKALSSITGVVGCGAKGELEGVGGIVTFEKWKQDVQIDKYAPPGMTDIANFINLVDLNLTRNHHMVSYGAQRLAGYVCNHTGPAKTAADPTALFPPQPEIDSLIRGIRSQASLVACVAMEYSTRGQAPGTKPFTKFFIFGPNGALLSTVDLDGRGPKGVPNVCTACHGGTFDYNTSTDGGITEHFDPAKNTSRPVGDLAAHFLPFDKANFAFSSRLPQAEQDERIFKLNLDIYTTEMDRVHIGSDGFLTSDSLAAASITDLVSAWYQNKLIRTNPAPGFDTSYVPIFWDYYNFNDAYSNSYAHNCRTCHVAMDRVPLDREPLTIQAESSVVCTSHQMPNAKVTYDRFWLSDPYRTFPSKTVPGQPASIPNQPEKLDVVLNCPSFNNP